jgi:hypothetical protein
MSQHNVLSISLFLYSFNIKSAIALRCSAICCFTSTTGGGIGVEGEGEDEGEDETLETGGMGVTQSAQLSVRVIPAIQTRFLAGVA